MVILIDISAGCLLSWSSSESGWHRGRHQAVDMNMYAL